MKEIEGRKISTEALDQAVRKINKALKKENDSRREIGGIVDALVEAEGGTQYGEDTIGDIAGHPDLQCSSRHVRKCWCYHLLLRDHEKDLAESYPTLKFGHLYELSRLLQIDDATVAVEAVHAMAKKAIDEGKDGKPMPADKLATAVTTHLKSLRKPNVPARDECDLGEAGDKGEEDKIEAEHAALTDAIRTVQEAAGKISASGEYRHAAETQTNVALILQAFAALLGHVVRCDPNSQIIPAVRRQIASIGKIVGLELTEASSEKGVAQ